MFSFDADVLIGFLLVYMVKVVKAVKVVKLKNVFKCSLPQSKVPHDDKDEGAYLV